MSIHSPISEQILKRLFDEYFHQLVRTAFQYVKDYDQAEEIVQDVFVKIWENFDQFQKVKDSKNYLFKAVRNSSMNFLKHVKVRQQFVVDSSVLNSSVEQSAEEVISKEETKKRIHEAINKLPENWKVAFVLSKYNQLKYHEIAEEMNISQKTVEKYISKALQFLRKELKDLLLLIFIVIRFFSDK